MTKMPGNSGLEVSELLYLKGNRLDIYMKKIAGAVAPAVSLILIP